MKATITQAERNTILVDARGNVLDVQGVTPVVMQCAAENGQWLRAAAMAVTRYAYQPNAGLLNGSLWSEIEEAAEAINAIESGDDEDALMEAMRSGVECDEWDYAAAACIELARLNKQL